MFYLVEVIAKIKLTLLMKCPVYLLYQQITGHPVPDVENAQYRLCYEAIGVFKDEAQVNSLPHWYGARPGDIIFKDVNADGKIDGLDRIRSERSNIPAFNGNLKFDVQYKQFDFAILLQGFTGSEKYLNPLCRVKMVISIINMLKTVGLQ